MTMPRLTLMILIAGIGLAGCSRPGDDVQLRRIKNTDKGPDEFSIIPGKPLEAPENFNILPTPTPGGTNRTDQNPRADGVAALGGNPAALVADGVSSADGALINHAGRFGIPAGIRQTLRRRRRVPVR